jgi:hypothetical protein
MVHLRQMREKNMQIIVAILTKHIVFLKASMTDVINIIAVHVYLYVATEPLIIEKTLPVKYEYEE